MTTQIAQTKKPAGKKHESRYFDANITVNDINITRLGLTLWKSPDGAVKRVYVSGQPAGHQKGDPWNKLGYISADREVMEWGDMDDAMIENIKVATKELLVK